MKLDKYLNESVTKVDWKKLSSDSKRAIEVLLSDISFLDMTETDAGKQFIQVKKFLDNVINNVYQDGYDKGFEEGRDEGIDYAARD